MPRGAVTIAYATAMQESKLQNLNYGDRDSVGVFQQRPSQGWGPRSDLENPVYATTKFFGALGQVPGTGGMPVYQAAQDVQHSADGDAYIQYEPMAAHMASRSPGRTRTRSSAGTPRPARNGADMAADHQRTGHATRRGARRDRPADGRGSAADGAARLLVRVVSRVSAGRWPAWLVTHASSTSIHKMRYGGLPVAGRRQQQGLGPGRGRTARRAASS